MALVAIITSVRAGSLAIQSNANTAEVIQFLQKHGVSRSSENGDLPKVCFLNLWQQGPPKGSSFDPFAMTVIDSLIQGIATTNAIGFDLSPENLTTSEGKIPWNAIMAMGVGTNEVSLSALVTRVSSPQDAGLSEVQVFGNSTYSPTAIGLKENGEVVMSGSGEQKVKVIILLVASPTYTASLDEVKRWFSQNANQFSLTMEMSIGQDSASSTISTSGYNATLPRRLNISNASDDQVRLNLPEGSQQKSYALVGFSDLGRSQGIEFLGNFKGTNSIPVSAQKNNLYFDFYPN